jgi:hypothetical protein
MLEKYLQMFAKLRTDRGRERYPALTYHRAPRKPFLLLSVDRGVPRETGFSRLPTTTDFA